MQKCSNCHCDIEESKILLHERFCFQNIKYCDICKEGIIKEEYEEHCLEHNNSEIKKEKSQEEKDNLSLKRLESTKIKCTYCKLLLSLTEVEENEQMCGSRTTKFKLCGERAIIKYLENHVLLVHGLSLSIYDECEPSVLSNNPSSFNLNKNNNYSNNNYDNNENGLSLNNMTSSEQLAYAMSLSEQEQIIAQEKCFAKEKKSKEKEEKKEEVKGTKKEEVKEVKKEEVKDIKKEDVNK